MKKLPFFILAVFAVYLTSCSYEPGDSGPKLPGKTVPPQSGSAYTYQNTPIDTNGVEQPDSSFFTIVAIADSGMTFAGKSNVTHITTFNLKNGSSSESYISYEANGDVSFYTGASIFSFIGLNLPNWNTFPVQTRSTSGAKVADTSIIFTGIPVALKAFDTTSYQGTGNSTVGGKDLPVVKMQHSLIFNGTATIIIPIPFTASVITTVSFAPSIGYYSERVNKPIKSPLPVFPSAPGMKEKLVSYHIN